MTEPPWAGAGMSLHGLVAVASYWLIVGRIERFEIRPRSQAGTRTAGAGA